MIEVYVTVAEHSYYHRIKQIRKFCAAVVRKAWVSRQPAEVSILLTSDRIVQKLNRKYRQIDKPTNVLSFGTDFRPRGKNVVWLAGDVVTAFKTISQEARALNISFEAHLAHLITHGVLHLQGYDHETLQDAKTMEELETKIVMRLGYDDPYKDVIK